jgi:DNA polymerase epsilon subunit 1
MSTRPEFGVSSSARRGRGGRYANPTRSTTSFQQFGLPTGGGFTEASNVDQRFDDIQNLENIETRFGFDKYQEGPERLGWLLNMHEVIS